jgi:hypothetical protein
MEKEVLSKHRKALMLFGTFHLMHGTDSDVSTYEKDYPNVTFVISDLGIYDTNRRFGSISPFALWLHPSIALTKGTWLGALSRSDIFPSPVNVDVDNETCKVQIAVPPEQQKPIEVFVDAFLYLGPQDFRLKEPMPADIALDADYMTELRRRESLITFQGESSKSQKEFSDEIVQEAQNPILVLEGAPTPPDAKDIEQSCLADKKRGSPR